MTARRLKWAMALTAVLLLVLAPLAMAQVSLTGTYRGTFIGDDYGWFVVEVETGGSITGVVHSNVSLMDMEVQGRWELDGAFEFMTVQEEGVPLYFLGQIDFMNRFLGKWSFDDHSGRGSFYGIIQRD
ncbi:MAG TPA: hypothetical protein PLK59_08465 [Synergistales bacterium]|jgi:hypothetical protein|nr:hypothetical protein [Synergistota bacterium]NLV64286.1 hypothetical protein [Synergistaceae bacterium]HOI82305.1 hypothetical protein [Synergistales bacterium]HPE91036.1 hypothetical protein [Synergistales bacterium]